eukprot:6153465-Pleurochrysis_carterae.AAC.1
MPPYAQLTCGGLNEKLIRARRCPTWDVNGKMVGELMVHSEHSWGTLGTYRAESASKIANDLN